MDSGVGMISPRLTPGAGTANILRYIDDFVKVEAQQVNWKQAGFAYVLMLAGFGALYWMITSTAKLREFRKSLLRVVGTERARAFGAEDFQRGFYAI